MTITGLLKPITSYTRSSISSALLRRLLHLHEPIILSQCFQDMPAITRWPQKSYLQKFSHQPIEIEVASHGSQGYGERHETTLGEYLTMLSQCLPYRIYMTQFPLFEKIPELKNDVTTSLVEDILQEGEQYSTSTWIGKRSLTPLHHDPRVLTNLFVQICGRKGFRIFSPEIKEKLKLGDGILGNTATIDVWKDEIAEGMEGTLSAGDGIIIPRGWWHGVRSEKDELNMSVNWWFKLKHNSA